MTIWGLWAAFLLATLAAAVVFLFYCLQHREQRGAKPLGFLFVGVSIWILSELVQLYQGQVRADPDPSGFGGLALRLLGIELSVIAVFLLGLEYTGRERWITAKTLAVLAVKPTLVIGLAVFQTDLLIDTVSAPASPWGYEVVPTPLWVGHVIYSFMLVFVGLALLAGMMMQSNYAYRWRIFALMVAISIPLTVNAMFHLGLTPFDPTASSFLVTATVLMYATFQWRLMDPTPVARRTVIEQMDELVFVLDEDGKITQANAAVFETLDTERVRDQPIATVFGRETFGDPATGDQKVEFTLTVDGESRQFDVTKSVLYDYRGDLLAQVLVCHDVTEKHQREMQLELLKDVQSRFLRHNLRNDLNAILAHAEFMRDEAGPAAEESYQVIRNTSDRLVTWGEKARTIERLVENADPQCHNIGADLDRIVSMVRKRYPHVTFRCDSPGSLWVVAVPQVDSAIENLLDNAARYNTSEEPLVEITTEQTADYVRIHMVDNGPGIDQAELEAIEAGKETQLSHTSGFGLWMAYWVIDTSGGEISFEVDNGTHITLEFERADPASAEQP